MLSKSEVTPGETPDGTFITPPSPVANLNRNEEDNESTDSSLHQVKSAGVPESEFKPSRKLYVAFATLSVITLMVALDGTSLSVALPVRALPMLC